MKSHFIFLVALLLLCGCNRDAASLRPYKDIKPGTPVFVQMKVKVTIFTMPTQPRRDTMLIGGDYVFEGISDGAVELRGTNGFTCYYAGTG
jgi:hypothetical protein